MKAFYKKYWEYIWALIIPLAVILVHCATRGVWPFGDRTLLRADASIQYIYIFEELWNKVHSGDFSSFSWNAVGGVDFYLNALYYTVSPATIIVLLLPKNCIDEVLQFFMIVKWLLMSFTTVYFFMHTRFNRLKKYRRWVSLVLGVCYVFGNYFIAIWVFFNWWDTLILFPILLLLIEKMVSNEKWKLYYLLLTISMLCNFYIAFPICIFLVFWFVLQLQFSPTKMLKKAGIFIGSSALSAVTAMGVIIPCVLNVSERYIYGQSNQNREYFTSIRMSFTEWIEQFFYMDVIRTVDLMGTPFYLSLGIIFISMLFVFIKMDKREKWGKVFVLSFIVLSFFVGFLNYAWHGFSIPHGIDQRYAFAFYMMLCIMALDVIYYMKRIRIWHVLVVIVVSVIAFVCTFFNLTEFADAFTYIGTIFLFVFYAILLVLYCRRSIKKKTLLILMLLLCVGEVCLNAYVLITWYDVEKPEEFFSIEDAEPLLEELELQDGERVIFADTGYNLGLKHGIPSMSGFVSYSHGGMSFLANSFGQFVLEDAGALYQGLTPVQNFIFNIRYGMGMWESEFSDMKKLSENNTMTLYEMQHDSSLGYMVEPTATTWVIDEFSVWNNQNRMVSSMLDEEYSIFKVFIPDDIQCRTALGELEPELHDEVAGNIGYQFNTVYESDGCIITFTADRDMDLYVNLRAKPRIVPYIYVDEKEIVMDGNGFLQSTVHIGKVKKGQEIKVVCSYSVPIGEQVEVVANFAEFDSNAFEAAYEKLSKNLYDITEMRSDVVKGNIVADEPGIMMTSIPAMKGFTVYVDGKETKHETIGGALIGVPLEAGEHTVEFRYETRYAKLAWLISLVGFAIFSCICTVDYFKKRKMVNE